MKQTLINARVLTPAGWRDDAHVVIAGGRIESVSAGAVRDEGEIFDLGGLVGGIQRQVDVAGAQHREVEQQRLDRFLGLHRHACAGRQPERIEQVGDHRRGALDVAPGVEQRRAGAVGGLDGDAVELGGKARAQGDEQVLVLVHGQSSVPRQPLWKRGVLFSMKALTPSRCSSLGA